MQTLNRLFFTDPNLKNNIDFLGRYSKNSLFPTKTFLSVNKSGEWNFRILNMIQLLLRKVLGWYEDTHLKVVASSWNSDQQIHGNVCPALSKKIAEACSKKFGIPLIEKPADVFIFGNSIPAEAALIGICQLHSDPGEAEFTAKIVRENYREGDIILVEGIDADKTVRPNEIPQTLYFPENTEIYGWEPVGFQALSDFVFESTIAIIQAFESQSALFIKLMQNINYKENPPEFSDSKNLKEESKVLFWDDSLRSAVENFIKTVGKIDARFEAQNSSNEAAQRSPALARLLNKFLDEYQQFALSQKRDEDAKKLLKIFSKLHRECDTLIAKNKYTKWTHVQNNFFVNTWDKRQESLTHEIQKILELQRRVVICAGAALFFPKRGQERSTSLNAMKNHKYCLIIQNNESNATYYSFADLASQFGKVLLS